jgi:uncharacterized protein YneF (UPF0154 family)
MSRRAAILFATASFLVGLIGGGWSVDAYWNHFANQFCINTMTAEAGMTLSELKWLRAGKTTNAFELMEVTLDGNLIGLGDFLADPRELKRDPSSIVILQKAKDYRTRYPHKSGDPVLDEGTAKAFHLLDGQKPSN